MFTEDKTSAKFLNDFLLPAIVATFCGFIYWCYRGFSCFYTNRNKTTTTKIVVFKEMEKPRLEEVLVTFPTNTSIKNNSHYTKSGNSVQTAQKSQNLMQLNNVNSCRKKINLLGNLTKKTISNVVPNLFLSDLPKEEAEDLNIVKNADETVWDFYDTVIYPQITSVGHIFNHETDSGYSEGSECSNNNFHPHDGEYDSLVSLTEKLCEIIDFSADDENVIVRTFHDDVCNYKVGSSKQKQEGKDFKTYLQFAFIDE
ncbi:uncharacterized protein LOC118182726 [Stegodyphus dumicola]|uniref:uncharacterized protein LOC118182726 n=1 Tax=Stegodyphus dumicola TaxID=202533 RepID=UPI0015A97AC4|nr:uncharacterized protein LOC118182726 [Stegodyphus dumicola]